MYQEAKVALSRISNAQMTKVKKSEGWQQKGKDAFHSLISDTNVLISGPDHTAHA